MGLTVTSREPSSPIVLDTRALGLQRRPGSMITVTRTAPAPEGLGVALARVAPGSPIDLDLRLESVLEGVLVSGAADLVVTAECARCLDPLDWEETVDLSELFAYPSTDARGAVVEEGADENDPLPTLDDDCIDLEPTLRDAVVLELPLAPLCRDDCAGLCAECGIRIDENPGHRHDRTDPRWAALSALTETDAGTS